MNSLDRSVLVGELKQLMRATTREGILHVLEQLKIAASAPVVAPA